LQNETAQTSNKQQLNLPPLEFSLQ
jgi:hypothetical protein